MTLTKTISTEAEVRQAVEHHQRDHDQRELQLAPGLQFLDDAHDAAPFSAAMAACRTIARHKVPRLLSFEVLSSTEQAPPYPEFAFLPNFYVDITPFLKQKIAAMKAYSRELKEFPHPRSLGGIEVLAKKRGMEIGFNAAEGFMLIRDEWK